MAFHRNEFSKTKYELWNFAIKILQNGANLISKVNFFFVNTEILVEIVKGVDNFFLINFANKSENFYDKNFVQKCFLEFHKRF